VKSWQQEFRKIETVNLRHCDRGRLTHVKAECTTSDTIVCCSWAVRVLADTRLLVLSTRKLTSLCSFRAVLDVAKALVHAAHFQFRD
jgi:hypothetical protein